MFWLPLDVFLQFLSFTLKERWVEVVFVCLQCWYPLFHHPLLSLLSLHVGWRLWHPDRACAWKQTAAAAPVTGPDRCAAGCRVAWRYRWMADRYHNHTSPLLSLTYWIKHLPSCSPPSKSAGDFSKCLWDEWGNMREVYDDTQQTRSPKLFLSQASSLNRPTSYLTAFCPMILQQIYNYYWLGKLKLFSSPSNTLVHTHGYVWKFSSAGSGPVQDFLRPCRCILESSSGYQATGPYTTSCGLWVS